jgi:3',5'-cyclic AMP phosphodiesterase CpdA
MFAVIGCRSELSLAVLVLACACTTPRAPEPMTAPMPVFHDGARLVVVGDVQRTSPLEAWREQNDPERAIVVAGIAETAPDLLAVTGDLVFDGGSDEEWSRLDALLGPIRARGVPAITAFGNHEYWRGRAAGEENVFARFPIVARRHFYTVAFGPLRLVVLDSNARELGADWDAQRAWYEATLAAADADATTRGVFVLMHHPPYTNSTVTGDEDQVQRAFVPAFLAAKKTLAMLCGHVHNYERFARGGKMFVVSGGGGGPRAKLATGEARRHPDDLVQGPPLRDFHFTIYTPNERGVDAEVRGVPKGGSALASIDRFALPWPSAESR